MLVTLFKLYSRLVVEEFILFKKKKKSVVGVLTFSADTSSTLSFALPGRLLFFLLLASSSIGIFCLLYLEKFCGTFKVFGGAVDGTVQFVTTPHSRGNGPPWTRGFWMRAPLIQTLFSKSVGEKGKIV